MSDSIIKSILLMMLAVSGAHCTDTDKAIDTDKSSEEFQADGSESTVDQKQDGTSQDDMNAFVNENPGNYYMDLYSIQTGPKQVEFGHVYENPNTWEQRYEKKDHENKRFQGQVPGKDIYNFSYRRGNEYHVKEHQEEANPHTGHFRIQARWGDKNGGYGEQYWDYNHDGHDQHDEPNEDPYGEPSLSVRSPTVDPSPSPYDVVDYPARSTSAIPSSTAYPKRKYPKKNRKRYEDPRKRTSKIPETSSSDGSYFTLPRERTAAHQMDDGPLRIDLYEQLGALPTTYDHVLRITPSTPRLRPSAART